VKNWSFFLTTEQVRRREKTVTRRKPSRGLPKVGELRQPVVKMQGIPKGGRVEKIGGPVRVTSVRFERLDAMTSDDAYGRDELRREGFEGKPGPVSGLFTPTDFVNMFCAHNGCQPWETVARIEFEYVESGDAPIYVDDETGKAHRR